MGTTIAGTDFSFVSAKQCCQTRVRVLYAFENPAPICRLRDRLLECLNDCIVLALRQQNYLFCLECFHESAMEASFHASSSLHNNELKFGTATSEQPIRLYGMPPVSMIMVTTLAKDDNDDACMPLIITWKTRENAALKRCEYHVTYFEQCVLQSMWEKYQILVFPFRSL